MTKTTKILKWLSGKKGVIVGIILTTVGYLGSIGELSPETVGYIGAMITLIFGTASYVTGKLVYPVE